MSPPMACRARCVCVADYLIATCPRRSPAPCYYVAARRRGAADCVPQTASYRDEADFHLKCKYGAATRSAPPHTGTRCTLATLLSGSVPVRILMININKFHK